MSVLPEIIVVGPQKAGTSWINRYFELRGDICLPNGVKEVFFFDRYFSKGADWYSAHFKHRKSSHKLCVEVGPTLFENPDCPQRVRDTLGPIPVICTLRDPAARTWSLYQHMLRYGMTRLPFREAVNEFHLYRGSQYATCISDWKKVMGDENVKLLFMEDLEDDADKFVNELCCHCGLEYSPVPHELKGKYFEGGVARNYWIARVTTVTAQAMRSMRLYRLVNAVRDTGLKDWIFGASGNKIQSSRLSREDRTWLVDNYFLKDIINLEKKTGRNLLAWRS